MTTRPIKVECYSGTRADETPRRIHINGREHIVVRVLAESVEEESASRHQTRRYKLLTDEGSVLEAVRESDGSWYLLF